MKRVVVPLVVALLAIAAGLQVFAVRLAAAHREQSARHRTEAVLLTATAGAERSPVALRRPPAEVEWTAPDGTRRTAVVQVSTGLAVGDHVEIWTNRSGAAVPQPDTAPDAIAAGIVGGALAVVAAMVTLSGWRAARREVVVRRAARDLDREWAQVGPVWTRRGAA